MASATRIAHRHLERRAYLETSDEAKAVVAQSLATLLSLLRAQSFSYQTSHWQVGGPSFYGDHLLFERLYASVGDQIDQLAEKMVGYHGEAVVNPGSAAEVMVLWVKEWAKTECHFGRGLHSEADAQKVIKQAYEAIQASGAMTLGLDDWLMATANAHEENTYLLQRVNLSQPSTEPVPVPEAAAPMPSIPVAASGLQRKKEV
jgi:DNA-binding ferritin-like protein